MNNKLFKLGALLVVLTLVLAVSAFAQLSTVYVDVTNGSNSYTGANVTNNPFGTGPKATIAGGLGALANNGTLVIAAGTYLGVDNASGNVDINTTTYPLLTGGLTIQLMTLLSNQQVLLSAGNFIFNVPGGVLNITTANNTEYFTLGAGAATLTLGSGANSSMMNISNSTFFQLPSGSSIVMNNTSSFTNAAPQRTTNVNLSYLGGGNPTAGPEANYGSYGTGSIVISKTAGTTVTFPYAITASGGIGVTSGNATFSSAVGMGASDITNGNTGALTFNGAVTASLTQGAGATNIASVINVAGGTITFNSTVTWTAGTFTGANVFPAAAGTYLVDNQAAGNVVFNGAITLVNSQATAAWHATVTANNGSGGTLSLASVTASTAGVGLTYVILNAQNTAASGVLNIAGGTYRGFLTNTNATGTTNVTGATSVAGILTNGGTIALGGNVLTLSGTVTHLTTGGTITSTVAGGLTVPATATFNGGTLSNLVVTSAGVVTISGNSIVTNLTVAGSLSIATATTLQANGSVGETGAITLTGSAGLLIKGDFNRTSGLFTAGATSTLTFNGTVAQAVNSGPNFQVQNLTFSNSSAIVTLGASIRAYGLVTVNASNNIALGTLNIILNAATAQMINNGTYSANGGGGVIVGGSNLVVGGYTGAMATTLSGSGKYSFITVDVGTGNAATLVGSIQFTGVLTLRSGTLTTGAFDISPFGTTASVVRYVQSAAAINTAGGSFDANAVDYDLTYTETLTGGALVTAGSSEFATANIRNLTVSTTAFTLTLAGGPITVKGDMMLSASALFVLPATNFTVNGALTVSTGAIMSGGNIANSFTLAGDGKVHTVLGTISAADILKVTAAGASLNGSTAGAGDAATIDNLAFEPVTNGSAFTSNNLKVVTTGPVTIQGTSTATGVTATIAMNATNATLNGGLNLGNGAITPTVSVTVAGSTTSLFPGAVTITNGALTLTRGGGAAATFNIGGAITISAGSLTLGSNLNATVATSQVAGNVVLGAYNFKQVATNYVRTGAGTLTASTGQLIMDANGVGTTLTPGTTFTVPNLTFIDAVGGFTNVVAAAMTVSNALVHTSDAVTLPAAGLTLSGNTYTYTAGTYTAGSLLIFTGNAAVGTFAGSVTIPNITLNSTGSLTIAGNPSTTARTITISGALTQTAGDINLGIHTIILTGGASSFVRTAGAWTMGTGLLNFNGAGLTFTSGVGWAVDNLTVTQAAGATANNAFAVNKYLTLVAGTFTTTFSGTTGMLVMGDNATIERQNNTAVLDLAPTFGATAVNLLYSTAVGIISAKEVPAANIIQNFTVTAASGVTLTTNIQINNTLDLAATLNAVTNSKTVTMAANTTLMLRIVGTTALDKDLNLLGALNIVYNNGAGFVTSTRELGALTSFVHLLPTGNVTFQGGGTFTTDGSITFGGTLKFNGASLNASSYTMNVNGDLVQTALGGFFASTVASTISFGGSTNTLLTLNATQVIGANDQLTINKTASANTVTLSGGDLDFATSPVKLYFVNGVLVTGGTSNVILKQSATILGVPNSGQPTQGFDRSGITGTNESHVYGRVKKYVNNDGNHNVDISVVTFPVGALTPTPYYRPMTYYFKSNPQSSINLIVTEVDQNAGGLSGFPITAGGLTITNFPPFFWYAKSDIPLAPSYQFDVEAQAKGYTDFFKDGIANIRLVRRDSGSVNNTWILQGNQNTYPPTYIYDNAAIAPNWPLVKAINATGGITTQGSIFSYSQGDKPPVFTAATTATSTTINEGQTLGFVYASTEPDLAQSVTLSVVTAATTPAGVATTVPTGYTFNATTGAFSYTAGVFDGALVPKTYKLTIRSMSSSYPNPPSDYTDTTVTISVMDVPRIPVWTTQMAASNAAVRVPFTFTYVATSPDVDRIPSASQLKYSIVTGPVGATIDSLTGVFSWTPPISAGGTVVPIQVQVMDAAFFTVLSNTVNLTVSTLIRVPAFTAAAPAAQSVNMGSNYTFTYVAADSDARAITYSVTKGGAVASINATTGAFTYYSAPAVPGTYMDTVIVQATNGTYPITSQTVFTRTYKNVPPHYTAKMADRVLWVGDTLSFTYAAADSNGDALTFYGQNYPNNATVNATTGKFFWVASSAQTAMYVIKTMVSDGQGGLDSSVATVTVQVTTVNVTGAVTYAGTSVPVNGVGVTITRTDVPGTTTLTTGTAGTYTTAPTKLNSGIYTFAFAKTGNFPSAYVNAADALKAALFFANPTSYPLSAGAQLAGDVNNDGVVNSSDALQIMLRYVGSITSFAKGDWLFIPQLTGTTLTTSDKVNNVVAWAVGDVNGDAQAGGAYFAKSGVAPSVSAKAGKLMKVNSTEVFEVPVRITNAASLGSVSLAFQYPTESASFLGVRGPDGMIGAENNGIVAVAWFSADRPMNLNANDAIVTLRFKPTKAFSDFAVNLDPNSQVTDSKGTVIQGVSVELPSVDASVPTVFGLGQNYPNPFNPSTTIQYDLPVAGHVTMVVYNTLGQVVDRLVDDQQNPGSYKIRWDASHMSSGIYMYQITVDAGKQTFKEVRRMVLLK